MVVMVVMGVVLVVVVVWSLSPSYGAEQSRVKQSRAVHSVSRIRVVVASMPCCYYSRGCAAAEAEGCLLCYSRCLPPTAAVACRWRWLVCNTQQSLAVVYSSKLQRGDVMFGRLGRADVLC